MSRKNKAARAFFHQNPDATPKDAWDAAWANNQSTFHAKSMQEAEARISELEAKLAAAEADAELKQECLEWLAEDCETETEYDGQMLSFCGACSALLDGSSGHDDDCLHLRAKAAIDAARGAK